MKKLLVTVALFAFATLQGPAMLAAQSGPERDRIPKLRANFLDLAGRVFAPGDEVTIQWELSGPGVKFYQNHVWGECELFFSTDGGDNWIRITPQLSISRRDYTWVVPDIPTTNARMGLQVGIEGEGDFHHFSSKTFTILPAAPAGTVELAAPSPAPLAGGSTLEIEWSSTVRSLDRFEVRISSDRGAHFFTVGETVETRYAYAIPQDYEGFLTVQIVAHRHGAAPLRSAIDDRSTYRVESVAIGKR